jgi:hypothetical protein
MKQMAHDWTTCPMGTMTNWSKMCLIRESGNMAKTLRKDPKKTQVKATRHSSTLKNHGGMSIEELAATRKKKHNLETPGNKQPNVFSILNDVDDNVLI